jgi:hypothetical protein
VTLDGSSSSGEGPLSYSWTHDCPAAETAGATGAMADLTFSAFAGTPIECTVNLVVADAVGQIASCEVTIRVEDTVPPTLSAMPPSGTPACDSIPSPADVTAIDAGDPDVPVVFAEASTPGDCLAEETITRTWNATDDAGNRISHTQTLSVLDTTAPAFNEALPADVTVECGAGPTAAVLTATDTCDSTPTVDYSEVRSDGICDDTYTLTRTWTATDSCGNDTIHRQTITVEDTTDPIISCPPDTTLEANVFVASVCGYTGPLTEATASDNCGMVDITHNALFPLPIGNTIVTWTATDECGNSSSCEQSITVEDRTPPETRCQDITIFLSAGGTRSTTADRIDNGSNDLCGIAGVELSQTLFDCTHLGANAVTLSVTDNNGNTSTCTVTVTVRDTQDPTIACPADITRSTNSSCGWVPEGNLGAPSADDNCVTGLVVTNNAPAIFDLGITSVTWTATDAAGHSTACEQLVTVVDDTPPSLTCPPDITRTTNSGGQFVPEGSGAGSQT